MHKIKTATACYTGGGIYIYYGQLESNLYFRTADELGTVYICNSDTEAEEADYLEFYEEHTTEEITAEEEFKTFWNAMLSHILGGGEAHGRWSNFSRSELECRIIK